MIVYSERIISHSFLRCRIFVIAATLRRFISNEHIARMEDCKKEYSGHTRRNTGHLVENAYKVK